jgi:hypothetical protein
LAAEVPGPAATSQDPVWFVDVAEASGLDFVHFNGMSGQFYFPEMTGQGGALLDYDGDGDLDVYLVQGGMLGPGETLAEALFPPPPEQPPGDRLFRNDLFVDAQGRVRMTFVDVTMASGVEALGYGMGVATGDFDNDGLWDLYVTNFGSNQMLHNRGDGTFSDVTAATGTDDWRWSTGAVFFDYDEDGWQDLYVVNYVDYDIEDNPECFAASSRRDYCGPADFGPLPDRLLRNRGDGTFEEVTLRALRDYRPGPGLAAAVADFDGDERIDLYVSNDGDANQLWLNQGDGTFVEDALLAGVAVNREGRAEASMGTAVADVDSDGDEDLFLTHLMGETNTFYRNEGGAVFEDRTIESGLAAPSLRYTSFGTGWIDFDQDGWLDLLVLNGAVRILLDLAEEGDPYPLHQPNQLFRNLAGEGFVEVTEGGGEMFRVSEVSRGAAFGDVDNDGDTDALLMNNNGRTRLLLNRAGDGKPWIGLRLLDGSTHGDRPGTRAKVARSDGREIWRRAHTDGSFCSASDPRVTAGLAGVERVDSLLLRWPRQRPMEMRQPPVGSYLVVLGPETERPMKP